MPQATKIVGPNCGGRLYVDRDNPAAPILEHNIHLDLVLGAIVVQLDSFLRPSELSGKFHGHEPFEQPTEWALGPKTTSIQIMQVGGDAGVNQGDLGGSRCSRSEIPRPAGIRLIRYTSSSKLR